MATIDSRIPLAFQSPQIKSPAQNKLAALAVQGKEMELQHAQRGMQQENALLGLMQRPDFYNESGGINPAMMPEIGRVAPGQALNYSKAIQGQQKALSDAQMAQLNQAKTQLELVGRLVGGVTDEASFQAARQQAQAYGIPLDGVPAQYDPNWVQQTRQQTLTAQQQIDNFYKEQGLNLQRERLELDRTAPRGQVVDTAQGVMIVDPRSGASRPAVGADNQPVLGERATQAQKQQRERQVEAIEARKSVDSAIDSLDRLAAEAKAIKDDGALWRVTGMVGSLPNRPGSEAADVQAKLETLRSQVGFSVLQAMRDASKTGGALGAISDRENSLLQNNLAALDTAQSKEAFQQSLQQIIDYAKGVKGRMNYAYQQQYGSGGQSQQGGGPQSEQQRSITRTGRDAQGRRVAQYSDGTIDYLE